jgi:hypothetical protein
MFCSMMRKFTEEAALKKRLDTFRQIWRYSMEIFPFITIFFLSPHNNFSFILAFVASSLGWKKNVKSAQKKGKQKSSSHFMIIWSWVGKGWMENSLILSKRFQLQPVFYFPFSSNFFVSIKRVEKVKIQRR